MKNVFPVALVVLFLMATISMHGQITTRTTSDRFSILENGTEKARFWFTGTSLFIDNNETNGNFTFRTNFTTRMYIANDGNIGIGTSLPKAHLEIRKNSATGFGHLRLTETGPGDFARLSLANSGSTGDDFWDLAGKAAGNNNLPLFNIFYFNGSSGANILSARGDTRRVAINDNTPDYTFEVNHPTSPTNSIFTGGNGLYIRNSGAAGTDWLLYSVNSDGSFAWLNGSNTVRAQIDPNNGNWVPGSDRKLKKQIQTMESDQLSGIMDLRPTSYQFKDQQSDRISFGLIAQEVQEVYPNIVVAMGEEGQQLGVSYTELIPVLIAGMQEQQAMIEDQKEKIKRIEQELHQIKDRLNQPSDNSTFEGQEEHSVLTGVRLDQNRPNPFSQNTRIRYFLPEGTTSASLLITNLEGRQLKRIDIDQRGEGTLTLQASALPAGMYLYTLLVDGEILETRRMVLTSGN